MKDAIKFGVTGIEMLNSKFKVLKLNGWSSEATRDMNRYDRSLTKLYTRYMRKGSVSPILELGFLLFGSMILCHMKNSFMGGMMGQPPPHRQQHSAPQRPLRLLPLEMFRSAVPWRHLLLTAAAAAAAAGSSRSENDAAPGHLEHPHGFHAPDDATPEYLHRQPRHGTSVESEHSSSAYRDDAPPPPTAAAPTMTVMMMGRMMPPPQMSGALGHCIGALHCRGRHRRKTSESGHHRRNRRLLPRHREAGGEDSREKTCVSEAQYVATHFFFPFAVKKRKTLFDFLNIERYHVETTLESSHYRFMQLQSDPSEISHAHLPALAEGALSPRICLQLCARVGE